MIKWNGCVPDNAEMYRGDYLIRWNLGDGYRDYAIKIVQSEN
jgi:hypothetical protein